MTTQIDDIVNTSITKTSSAVQRAGFGVPLFVSTNTVITGRIQYFQGDILGDMVTAGFATSDRAYEMVAKCLAQSPAPNRVAVGAAIAADAGDWTVTMAAIAVVDNSGWYMFTTETKTQADNEDLALWAEANKHVLFAETQDADVKAGTAGNVAEVLQGLSYRRTALFYAEVDEDICSAAIGVMAVANLDSPNGSIDMAFEQLVGVTPVALTGAERAIIHGLACNTYELRMGRKMVFEGNLVGGTVQAPIPISETVSLDWLDARTTEDVFGWLGGAKKRNFNQTAVDAVVGTVDARWQLAIQFGHLSTSNVPPVVFSELQKSDIAATHLTPVMAYGTIATPLRKVTVVGKVAAA